MMVLSSQGGKPAYGLKEYLIGSADDLVNLPVNIPVGSCALDVTTGTLYFLHEGTPNEWKAMGGD